MCCAPGNSVSSSVNPSSQIARPTLVHAVPCCAFNSCPTPHSHTPLIPPPTPITPLYPGGWFPVSTRKVLLGLQKAETLEELTAREGGREAVGESLCWG